MKQTNKSEERKKKRKELEQGNFETVSVDEVVPSDEIVHDSSIDQDNDETYVLLSPLSSTSSKQTIVTRRSAEQSKQPQKVEQVGVPSKPVRIERIKGSGTSHQIDPKYLKAMPLIMADNKSASEAIKVVHTVDTVIHDQVRHLPLRLEKHYVNAVQRLKKIGGITNDNEDNENESVLENKLETISSEGSVDDATSKEIKHWKKTIKDFIDVRKNDMKNVLPDTTCVRANHNLISVFVEGKIADEIIEHQAFVIPDGTSRQGIGEMAAAVVKVGGKMQAIKGVQIGKGDRKNWARAIYHMLDRLSTASSSGHKISSIWKQIVAMLSDLCKVNLDLAKEVRSLIGVEWLPGQIFCNLHYTLAIPEGIKKTLISYQNLIGSDKLFPKNVGFEMNLEDKLIVIQVLDCWMRLTSIRWQSKPWNKYENFTEFAERKGIKNVGHMIHANRFGEFEERCAGGVYLIETWMAWLQTFSDVRNQLSCYLRSVMSIMDMCKFLWAGAALIGIHITAPFMSMLLDHRVTPRKLLVILPQLYDDLKAYSLSLVQIDECGITAMREFFLHPLKKESAPYGLEVSIALKVFIESCDKDLMAKYLKQVCNELAIILKRQRGNQYGFGDDPDSSDHIKKNMTESMLDDPDANHSKPIENYFGNMDREIKKSGPAGFDKCTSDLIIKYSQDLIGDDDMWRAKANRKAAKEIDIKQKEFDKTQKELISLGVDNADIETICSENRVIKVVSKCKESHNGPIDTTDDLHKLVQEKAENEKELHKCLNLEIRFRKFTLNEVKSTCPLFRQKGLSIQLKVKNLEALIDSQLNFKALASMSDLEEAIGMNTEHSGTVLDAEDDNGGESVEDTDNELDEEKNIATDHQKDNTNTTAQPYKPKEFVLVLFDDGAYPSEVVEVKDDIIDVSCMNPVVVRDQKNFRYWKWPSSEEKQPIHKQSILPIRPHLDVSREYSSRKRVVFELVNFELVEMFT